MNKPRNRTPEYRAWEHLRYRCDVPTNPKYHLYGARGITYCERWASFDAFFADMGPRPSPKHSIDRINNDVNYEPGNCRWATIEEQQNNRRNNRVITHGGQSLTLIQWARKAGIHHTTLAYRLEKGWPISVAVTRPPRAGVRPCPGDLRKTTEEQGC